MGDYNKYYKTEDLFGVAYSELIDFFRDSEPKGKLLDVGCGQGRNAIPLAQMGYTVTGIDSSQTGIEQMLSKSKKAKLDIIGICGDMFRFDDYGNFDFVLLDSMFHFTKRDFEREKSLILKIAGGIASNGIICFFLQDTGSKVRTLEQIISDSKLGFEIIKHAPLVYNFEDKKSGHKSETRYCMHIIRKN